MALVGTLVHHRATSVRAEVTKMFWEIAGAHGICPEVHPPRPGVRNSGGRRLGPAHTPGPGRPGSGAVQPHRVPQGGSCPTTVPAGQNRHAAHRQAATPRHVPPDGATRNAVAWAPRATPPPSPDNDDPWPTAVRSASTNAPMNTSIIAAMRQGPTNHPGWRDALAHLFHTTAPGTPA